MRKIPNKNIKKNHINKIPLPFSIYSQTFYFSDLVLDIEPRAYIGQANFICPSTGEHQGQKNENGWVGKWGGGYGGLLG